MKLLQLPMASPATTPPASGLLVDSFGRMHGKCRVSLTDKCNLRCVYCMEEETRFAPEWKLLTAYEISHACAILYRLGVRKFRLTGGEPLLRKDAALIAGSLSAIGPDIDLSVTTNGILLERHAGPLFQAGVRTVNISLDSIDRIQFRNLTKRWRLEDVLNGIRAAKDTGFPSIKINSVILRDANEDQIIPLATYSIENQLEIRFIESMPIGANPWDKSGMVSGARILDILSGHFGPLKKQDRPGSSPAETWVTPQGGVVGIIASVTRPFCSNCDRIRLTADGFLRACLFSTDETDIKPMLRPALDPDSLERAIRSTVWGKPSGHQISTPGFVKPARTMHAIGG